MQTLPASPPRFDLQGRHPALTCTLAPSITVVRGGSQKMRLAPTPTSRLAMSQLVRPLGSSPFQYCVFPLPYVLRAPSVFVDNICHFTCDQKASLSVSVCLILWRLVLEFRIQSWRQKH